MSRSFEPPEERPLSAALEEKHPTLPMWGTVVSDERACM